MLTTLWKSWRNSALLPRLRKSKSSSRSRKRRPTGLPLFPEQAYGGGRSVVGNGEETTMGDRDRGREDRQRPDRDDDRVKKHDRGSGDVRPDGAREEDTLRDPDGPPPARP